MSNNYQLYFFVDIYILLVVYLTSKGEMDGKEEDTYRR